MRRENRETGSLIGAGTFDLTNDVIMRARQERARWAGELGRRVVAWLRSRVPAGPTSFLARRRRAAEIHELLALDNRTLADIGLRREDLWGVVHGEVDLQRLTERKAVRREAEVVPLWRTEPVVERSAQDLDRAA